ncbi:MAG: serine/threonine-protein kinase, partial [Myxococcota bacterium]
MLEPTRRVESFIHTEDAAPSGPADRTLRAGNESSDSSASLGRTGAVAGGMTLGRYLVLRELGAGSMGSVYLGYDPELDRRVALKVLKGTSQAANRTALLREAQAMAKLRHPRVVAVHDVGEHQGRVYIAMEYIEGITLRAWAEAVKRSWREVLDMYREAGEGLSAAHERGLIHRDFKPENVMVAAPAEVTVMDFGLARASSGSEEPLGAGQLESMTGRLLAAATLGHVAGSPGYMAPEQFRGEELTAAADQFAFCVSLWEAICGQRPFAEGSFA